MADKPPRTASLIGRWAERRAVGEAVFHLRRLATQCGAEVTKLTWRLADTLAAAEVTLSPGATTATQLPAMCAR